MPPDDLEWLRWVVAVALPALSAVGGVFLGAYMSQRREIKQRRSGFIERQLRELYSPLLGLREEIRAQSELRVSIQDKADVVWERLCDKAEKSQGPSGLKKLQEERGPIFLALIKYDNTKLREELLPTYRKMVATFRDNFWLAEPATRAH